MSFYSLFLFFPIIIINSFYLQSIINVSPYFYLSHFLISIHINLLSLLLLSNESFPYSLINYYNYLPHLFSFSLIIQIYPLFILSTLLFFLSFIIFLLLITFSNHDIFIQSYFLYLQFHFSIIFIY